MSDDTIKPGDYEKQIAYEVSEYMLRHYGERCLSYARGCGVCDAWVSYDYLFNFDNLGWDGKTSTWYPKNVPKEEHCATLDFVEDEWGDVLRELAKR